jgi:hypothetical protein
MPQAHTGATTYISGTGINGWTLDDILYVSDGGINPKTGNFFSFALPEIYTTSGTQAAQWFNLNLYSHYLNNRPLNIYGVLTEYDADNTTNAPDSGWNQLAGYMKSSPSVTGPDLADGTPFMHWSTDISWKLPNQP